MRKHVNFASNDSTRVSLVAPWLLYSTQISKQAHQSKLMSLFSGLNPELAGYQAIRVPIQKLQRHNQRPAVLQLPADQ
jgi:hypothetical protein